MSKEWQQRLDDTINFIETAAVPVHANKRRAIAKLLRDLKFQGLIPQATSDAMSQGSNWAIRHRDTVKDNRHYRRAVILVQTQLLGQAAAAAAQIASSIADSSLPLTLGNALGVAYSQAQAPLLTAYQSLMANPGVFLANNKVQLFGAPASGTTPHGFYFEAHANRYAIKPIDPSLDDEVFIDRGICNIHVQPYSGIAGNVGAIVGHQVAHTDLVITTQLTGCAVVFDLGVASVNLMAAHIQPTGTPNSAGRGYNLVATLRGGGVGFSNALPGANVTVFGASQAGGVTNYDPGLPPARHTFWLGVRTAANGWEVHCQRHNVGDETDPGVTWRIA